jgi:transposase
MFLGVQEPGAMTMVTEGEPAAELPERWSAKAKMEQVLRLMRGEAVDAVSREIQVPAHELEQWRRDFLDGGLGKLKRRTDGTDRALREAQAKIGELTMELELVEMLLEKRGYADELMRLKRSRGQ